MEKLERKNVIDIKSLPKDLFIEEEKKEEEEKEVKGKEASETEEEILS